MTARLRLALAILAFAPAAALAAPPVACSIITADDINPIAARPVEKFRLQKSGNPSECAFLDSRNGAVLVVSLKEVRYAVKDEFEVERGNLEKIYRVKSKPVETVGDGGFWLAANKSLVFRKGMIIGSVSFQTPKNQNELDTSQVARLVESRLK
ncbi:MAG TPA: hypothetical protein VEC19_08185 [Usitatibacter sp.]|nr:hypothetical protein [Usitatibacter sp.]